MRRLFRKNQRHKAPTRIIPPPHPIPTPTPILVALLVPELSESPVVSVAVALLEEVLDAVDVPVVDVELILKRLNPRSSALPIAGF